MQFCKNSLFLACLLCFVAVRAALAQVNKNKKQSHQKRKPEDDSESSMHQTNGSVAAATAASAAGARNNEVNALSLYSRLVHYAPTLLLSLPPLLLVRVLMSKKEQQRYLCISVDEVIKHLPNYYMPLGHIRILLQSHTFKRSQCLMAI